jgi:hypothetical protein
MVKGKTMAADDFVYPLLFIDKVNAWVDVIPEMADAYLMHWTFPPPGAIGDVVLIDSSGQMYDVKRVALVEGLTRPAFWGSGRRPYDGEKKSYEYELIDVGKIAWPEVLNLVCQQLDGDFGMGLLDYPDDFEVQISKLKSELMSCADIIALSEVFGVAYLDEGLADRAEDELVKARVWVVGTGLVALILFLGWLSNVREIKGGGAFLVWSCFLAQRIAALRSLVRVAPVNNRRVAA